MASVGGIGVQPEVDLRLLGSLVLETEAGRQGRAVGQRLVAVPGLLGEVAPGDLVADRVSGVGPARANVAQIAVAEPKVHEAALLLAGRLCPEVDHARKRVGSPDRGAGAAQDLDLLDLVELDREVIPQDEPLVILVGRAAVQERQLALGQQGAWPPERSC